MMKKLLAFLCLWMALAATTSAQQAITGRIVDKESKEGLFQATLQLLKKDSTFVNGYQVKSKFMDLRILQKILNSSVMEEYIEMTSKSYQGGWKSYAKSYIMNFSVPRFTKEQLEFLEKENDQDKINKFLENIYFNSKKEIQSTLI